MNNENFKDKYLAEIAPSGVLTSGSYMKRVSDLLITSTQQLYDKLDIDFKPVWFSILLALKQNGTMDIKSLAEKRGVSKSAISQIIKEMKKKGLLTIKTSKIDHRQKDVDLTEYGINMTHQLVKPLKLIQETLEDMYGDEWDKFRKFLERVDTEMRNQPFAVRKLRPLQGVRISYYDPEFKEDFKTLNKEWIEKFFKWEKNDEKYLGNPEKEIIANKGEVFFAIYNNKAIGTVALMHKSNDVVELTRLAVSEEYQERGVASKLLDFAISCAQENQYKEMFLSTSESLKPAVSFFQKHGFQRIDYEGSTLARVNVQMVLKI